MYLQDLQLFASLPLPQLPHTLFLITYHENYQRIFLRVQNMKSIELTQKGNESHLLTF